MSKPALITKCIRLNNPIEFIINTHLALDLCPLIPAILAATRSTATTENSYPFTNNLPPNFRNLTPPIIRPSPLVITFYP